MIDKVVMSTILVAVIIILIILAVAKPSAYAVLQRKDRLAGAFFICSIISFFILSQFSENVDAEYRIPFIFATLLFFVASLMSAIYLYIISFKINENLADYFQYDVSLDQLAEDHGKHVSKSKALARCSNYHNGRYYKNKNLECEIDTECKSEEQLLKLCHERKGAKIVDFYIMSSNQSCLIPYTAGNYVSTKMLESVIGAGARFLDFDVYSKYDNDGKIMPIVQSEWLEKKPLNYITLHNCFLKIREVGFLKHYNDPLFVHLNLKTNNIETLNKIANLFLTTFSGDNLIGPGYHYKDRKSISKMPICKFLKKIILVVSGNCEGTYLDEITNIHTSHNARIVSESKADYPGQPHDFAFDNQNMLTILKPDLSTNLNPSRPFSHGCQFVLMNLWKYTKQVKTHANFFKNCSFVLKKFDLQQKRLRQRRI